MQTGPLDHGDDAALARFHEILWRAEMEDGRPWNTMWSLEELAALLREPTPELRTEGYAAWRDGEMVGAGFAMLSLLDNTDKAFAFVAVEQPLRRQGIGSALLRTIQASLLQQGRTTVTGLAACHFEERTDGPQPLFARHHGYTVASTEVQRTLTLPVAAGLLDEVEREIAPLTAGYEIRTVEGRLPEELAQSYCDLANQLVIDAPTGEMDYEAEAVTPEVEDARRERDLRSGRTLLTALALHEGRVVAYTDLAVPRAGDHVLQRGTYVDRAHRGHRLGAAVKVANLRRLQDRFPHAERIDTSNAEVNAQMVGINERLGFVARAVVPHFVRRFAPVGVTVRDVDLGDREDLASWHAAGELAHDHDRPDVPYWSLEEALAVVRDDDPEERFLPFVAETATGEVVGSGIAFVPLLDNLDKVHGHVAVLPEHRGSRIGDLLVERVRGVAADGGRRVVIVETHLPVDHAEGHPVRRFAARHGFALANQEVRRILQLPVPPEVVQRWADDAAPHHRGYDISTHEDVVPEHLQASLVELLNQLAVDAPTGEIEFEAGGQTVEIYREHAERRRALGRRTYETVAVRDGRVVAQTTLSVPPPGQQEPFVNQWGTYVHRDHRGHRLGLAVKAANLRVLQERHPERTVVTTTNSPVNAPMVAINETMGFRPVEVMAEFLLRL